MSKYRQRLERCVRECARRAWSVAYGLLRDRDEAFDAVQQAFVVAARKPDRIPTDDPWPWFGVVVAHEARNLRRKKRPATNLPYGGDAMESSDPRHGDPLAAYERQEARERLRTALDALPPMQRDAIVLTHIAGLTHAAAAEALGIPRQTLTTHAQSGRSALARELRTEPARLQPALAVLPMALPPGGWGVAMESWTQTAGHALTSSAAAATTAAGGIGLMTSKTIFALSLTAALGVGFLGAHVVHPTGDATDEDPTRAQPRSLLSADADPARRAPGLDPLPPISVDDARAVVEENRQLQAAIDRLEAEARRLRASMQAADAISGGKRGPVFTFGQVGQLAAIQEANWGEMAQASQAVMASMLEILDHKQAGTQPPRETYLRAQENVERIRKYEYRTIDKIPSAAKHNGELTHPITMSNLLAAILSEGGQPLSTEQVTRIEQLGVAFEQAYAKQGDRYGPVTPRVQRMLDEYRLKGRFQDDVLAVLSDAQRALVVNPRTSGIAGLDLYGPTLMILHTSPVLAGKTPDEIRAKLRNVLAQKLKLEGEEAACLEAPLRRWAARI